jgi:hypothetical protein
MANNVFADGREISCKAADGKSICAFPDVCLTPPENPATPPGVPVPYPNTAFAKDSTNGSKTVKISGKEVMLKNKSYFKRSTGDEAGCAAKKGVLTSTNMGKVYFNSWSMDVKCEGENVVRHLDVTTHNHMSQPPNTPPMAYQDGFAVASADDPDCAGASAANQAGAAFLEKNGQHDADTVVAGAKFVPNAGPPTLLMGSNKISPKQVIPGFKYQMWAKGTTRNPSPSVKCKKHPNGFKYPRGKWAPRSGDAEAKIIEELFRTEGGKPAGRLYLKVSGRPVCCSCQALIRCAQESSDLKVIFCPPVEFDKCK